MFGPNSIGGKSPVRWIWSPGWKVTASWIPGWWSAMDPWAGGSSPRTVGWVRTKALESVVKPWEAMRSHHLFYYYLWFFLELWPLWIRWCHKTEMSYLQSYHRFLLAHHGEEDVAMGEMLFSIPLDLIIADKSSPCAAIKQLRNELQRGKAFGVQVITEWF